MWSTAVHLVSFDRNLAGKHQNHSETDRQMVADCRKVAELSQSYARAEAETLM